MPRKSNLTRVGTGEEHDTPAKEKADGVNIEVSLCLSFSFEPLEYTVFFCLFAVAI